MKYGFALHTTTPELGLSINNFAGDTRSQFWHLGREMATHLHLYIAEFLSPQTWQDLSFIAVAKGPGGFTGTRLGVVTARTLAQQLEIPLFGVSSMAAIAFLNSPYPPLVKGNLMKYPLVEGGSIKDNYQHIAVQMPAQRGELFVGIYIKEWDKEGNTTGLYPLLPDRVMKPETWQETLESWPNSYQLIEVENREKDATEGGLGITVSSILELAYLEWQQGNRPHWEEILPYYGQHPVDK
ncbi:MAG: tRNA (adenosine(37)-N6)-threonylcarbamoyltransferase complex dimerization subunit type 1 TsaB [Microcoleaceae cyanobacterium]|jgi:tRNA threonylcarbamoyl adenosine modification protein YeaZ